MSKLLFYPLPQPIKAQTFLNLQPPEQFEFPLQKIKLQGIQLIQNFYPEDINKKITSAVKGKIQKISRYNQKLCAIGKNGLLCGNLPYDIPLISAFSYGPNYSIIAKQDRSITIHTMADMKTIKQIKDFTQKKITFIKEINIPKTYQGMIILLTSSGYDLTVHRIQKSIFTSLTVKLKYQILSKLYNPITHIIEIPQSLRENYLSKDQSYKDSNLICVMSIDRIWIIKILTNQLESDKFWQTIYEKKFELSGITSASWGQALINSVQKQIYGDKLVLTYSFGCNLYLLVLNFATKYLNHESKKRYEWIESFPLKIQQDKNIAFCQYMKKNQILLIFQSNQVVIFHTEGVNLFDRAINIQEIPTIRYEFSQKLKYRQIEVMERRKIIFSKNIIEQPPQQQKPVITFSDSFSYEYQSNQIHFLTQNKFGFYVYLNWKQICDHLKIEQKYEIAMNFLIALYKKVNRFDFGMTKNTKNRNNDSEIGEYARSLATLFIKTKFTGLKVIPGLSQTINRKFLLSIPIDFLSSVQQFKFLFEGLKKIILSYQNEDEFYIILEPFICYGRIKYIPDTQLRQTFEYYISKNKFDIIERLSAYFDMSMIDRSIVIHYLFKLNLLNCLANVCIQGNENQFLTPFVKFWGLSENQKNKKNQQQAKSYAEKALWYVKICLQKNMALKQYSFEKYAEMINILTLSFFTKKMIMQFLKISNQCCFQTLTYYFSPQIAKIVNQNAKFKNQKIQIKPWIKSRPGNEKIQILLSAFTEYFQEMRLPFEDQKLYNLLLTKIIIYKTIKFTKSKYIEIIDFVIENYKRVDKIKQINVKRKGSQDISLEFDEIVNSDYIIKILLIVMQEEINKQDLKILYESATKVELIQLQAYIHLLQNEYHKCIQIFLKGKPKDKKRIFSFLVTSFKNYFNTKLKNQFNAMKSILSTYIRELILLDSKQSRSLIFTYLPEYREELVFALDSNQEVQLEYLQQIINDRSLSEQVLLKYVELMAKKIPMKLLESFRKHDYFPIQQSITICEKYQIYDCMQYLYERMGQVQRSVQIACLRINNIFLQKVQNKIDALLAYNQIDKILQNAIQACIRNHSEEIWESLLDGALILFEKYINDILFEKQIEVFYAINAKILYEMVNHTPIQYIVQLFQNKYKMLDMGGKMKKAFIQILSNFSYIQLILLRSSKLTQKTYFALYDKYITIKLKSYHPDRICHSCQYIITKSDKNLGFFCGHTYHRQCLIETTPLYCINCMYKPEQQLKYFLSLPNPQNPKIKIQKLFEESEKLRLQMRQRWKVQQFEESQKPPDILQLKQKQQSKKRDKFKLFDQINIHSEDKTQKIINQVGQKFEKLKLKLKKSVYPQNQHNSQSPHSPYSPYSPHSPQNPRRRY